MSQYKVKKLDHPIHCTVEVPGSKSITNRALLMAALSQGECTLKGVLFSDDSRHFLLSLIALGYIIEVNEVERYVIIHGHGRDTVSYTHLVGIKFTYEIDAENIIITDEENDSDTFSWNEVVKWNQDPDNIYLFVGDDNCLVVSKKGFTQGSADDLRQLADAVIGMRNVTGNSQQ